MKDQHIREERLAHNIDQALIVDKHGAANNNGQMLSDNVTVRPQRSARSNYSGDQSSVASPSIYRSGTDHFEPNATSPDHYFDGSNSIASRSSSIHTMSFRSEAPTSRSTSGPQRRAVKRSVSRSVSRSHLPEGIAGGSFPERRTVVSPKLPTEMQRTASPAPKSPRRDVITTTTSLNHANAHLSQPGAHGSPATDANGVPYAPSIHQSSSDTETPPTVLASTLSSTTGTATRSSSATGPVRKTRAVSTPRTKLLISDSGHVLVPPPSAIASAAGTPKSRARTPIHSNTHTPVTATGAALGSTPNSTSATTADARLASPPTVPPPTPPTGSPPGKTPIRTGTPSSTSPNAIAQAGTNESVPTTPSPSQSAAASSSPMYLSPPEPGLAKHPYEPVTITTTRYMSTPLSDTRHPWMATPVDAISGPPSAKSGSHSAASATTVNSAFSPPMERHLSPIQMQALGSPHSPPSSGAPTASGLSASPASPEGHPISPGTARTKDAQDHAGLSPVSAMPRQPSQSTVLRASRSASGPTKRRIVSRSRSTSVTKRMASPGSSLPSAEDGRHDSEALLRMGILESPEIVLTKRPSNLAAMSPSESQHSPQVLTTPSHNIHKLSSSSWNPDDNENESDEETRIDITSGIPSYPSQSSHMSSAPTAKLPPLSRPSSRAGSVTPGTAPVMSQELFATSPSLRYSSPETEARRPISPHFSPSHGKRDAVEQETDERFQSPSANENRARADLANSKVSSPNESKPVPIPPLSSLIPHKEHNDDATILQEVTGTQDEVKLQGEHERSSNQLMEEKANALEEELKQQKMEGGKSTKGLSKRDSLSTSIDVVSETGSVVSVESHEGTKTGVGSFFGGVKKLLRSSSNNSMTVKDSAKSAQASVPAMSEKPQKQETRSNSSKDARSPIHSDKKASEPQLSLRNSEDIAELALDVSASSVETFAAHSPLPPLAPKPRLESTSPLHSNKRADRLSSPTNEVSVPSHASLSKVHSPERHLRTRFSVSDPSKPAYSEHSVQSAVQTHADSGSVEKSESLILGPEPEDSILPHDKDSDQNLVFLDTASHGGDLSDDSYDSLSSFSDEENAYIQESMLLGSSHSSSAGIPNSFPIDQPIGTIASPQPMVPARPSSASSQSRGQGATGSIQASSAASTPSREIYSSTPRKMVRSVSRNRGAPQLSQRTLDSPHNAFPGPAAIPSENTRRSSTLNLPSPTMHPNVSFGTAEKLGYPGKLTVNDLSSESNAKAVSTRQYSAPASPANPADSSEKAVERAKAPCASHPPTPPREATIHGAQSPPVASPSSPFHHLLDSPKYPPLISSPDRYAEAAYDVTGDRHPQDQTHAQYSPFATRSAPTGRNLSIEVDEGVRTDSGPLRSYMRGKRTGALYGTNEYQEEVPLSHSGRLQPLLTLPRVPPKSVKSATLFSTNTPHGPSELEAFQSEPLASVVSSASASFRNTHVSFLEESRAALLEGGDNFVDAMKGKIMKGISEIKASELATVDTEVGVFDAPPALESVKPRVKTRWSPENSVAKTYGFHHDAPKSATAHTSAPTSVLPPPTPASGFAPSASKAMFSDRFMNTNESFYSLATAHTRNSSADYQAYNPVAHVSFHGAESDLPEGLIGPNAALSYSLQQQSSGMYEQDLEEKQAVPELAKEVTLKGGNWLQVQLLFGHLICQSGEATAIQTTWYEETDDNVIQAVENSGHYFLQGTEFVEDGIDGTANEADLAASIRQIDHDRQFTQSLVLPESLRRPGDEKQELVSASSFRLQQLVIFPIDQRIIDVYPIKSRLNTPKSNSSPIPLPMAFLANLLSIIPNEDESAANAKKKDKVPVIAPYGLAPDTGRFVSFSYEPVPEALSQSQSSLNSSISGYSALTQGNKQGQTAGKGQTGRQSSFYGSSTKPGHNKDISATYTGMLSATQARQSILEAKKTVSSAPSILASIVPYFTSFSAITTLSLTSCNLTLENIHSLPFLPSLKVCDLSDNPLTGLGSTEAYYLENKAMRPMRNSSIRGNVAMQSTRISSLARSSLNRNSYKESPAQLDTLSKATVAAFWLRFCPSLESLSLRGCRLTEVPSFLALQGPNCVLRELDLSGNNISNTHGLETIANSLQVLDLSYNNMISTLAFRSLSALKELTVLNLHPNPCTLQGRQSASGKRELTDSYIQEMALKVLGGEVSSIMQPSMHYRTVITGLLPQLCELDGKNTPPSTKKTELLRKRKEETEQKAKLAEDLRRKKQRAVRASQDPSVVITQQGRYDLMGKVLSDPEERRKKEERDFARALGSYERKERQSARNLDESRPFIVMPKPVSSFTVPSKSRIEAIEKEMKKIEEMEDPLSKEEAVKDARAKQRVLALKQSKRAAELSKPVFRTSISRDESEADNVREQKTKERKEMMDMRDRRFRERELRKWDEEQLRMYHELYEQYAAAYGPYYAQSMAQAQMANMMQYQTHGQEYLYQADYSYSGYNQDPQVHMQGGESEFSEQPYGVPSQGMYLDAHGNWAPHPYQGHTAAEFNHSVVSQYQPPFPMPYPNASDGDFAPYGYNDPDSNAPVGRKEPGEKNSQRDTEDLDVNTTADTVQDILVDARSLYRDSNARPGPQNSVRAVSLEEYYSAAQVDKSFTHELEASPVAGSNSSSSLKDLFTAEADGGRKKDDYSSNLDAEHYYMSSNQADEGIHPVGTEPPVEPVYNAGSVIPQAEVTLNRSVDLTIDTSLGDFKKSSGFENFPSHVPSVTSKTPSATGASSFSFALPPRLIPEGTSASANVPDDSIADPDISPTSSYSTNTYTRSLARHSSSSSIPMRRSLGQSAVASGTSLQVQSGQPSLVQPDRSTGVAASTAQPSSAVTQRNYTYTTNDLSAKPVFGHQGQHQGADAHASHAPAINAQAPSSLPTLPNPPSAHPAHAATTSHTAQNIIATPPKARILPRNPQKDSISGRLTVKQWTTQSRQRSEIYIQALESLINIRPSNVGYNDSTRLTSHAAERGTMYTSVQSISNAAFAVLRKIQQSVISMPETLPVTQNELSFAQEEVSAARMNSIQLASTGSQVMGAHSLTEASLPELARAELNAFARTYFQGVDVDHETREQLLDELKTNGYVVDSAQFHETDGNMPITGLDQSIVEGMLKQMRTDMHYNIIQLATLEMTCRAAVRLYAALLVSSAEEWFKYRTTPKPILLFRQALLVSNISNVCEHMSALRTL